tara:strand:+ start:748 stop:999 length:252 start_codon:yes stop_codon:yes gene_type:complete
VRCGYGGVREGCGVATECPDGEHILEVAVGDHAVLIEDPADALLLPVPILELPLYQEPHAYRRQRTKNSVEKEQIDNVSMQKT